MASAVIIPFAPETSESTAARKRYEGAYRVAERTITFGETVRLGGIFLAGVIWMGAVVAFQASPAERSGFPVVSASLTAGAILVILLSHVLSMLVRAQAQLLVAAVDTAVMASPFLSNAQRGAVMSWGKAAGLVGWECARVRDLALLAQRRQAAPRGVIRSATEMRQAA